MNRIVPIACAVTAICSACLDLTGGCGNETLADVAAPSGDKRAVVFTRNCGATTEFSAHVSVIAVGDALPDRGGNVLSVGADHLSTDIDIEWTAPDSLSVRYRVPSGVFAAESRPTGVAVAFIPDSSDGEPPPRSSAPTTAPDNADSLLVAFEQVALALGHSRDSIFAALGPPHSITIREAENEVGGRDSLITVRYSHVEFLLRKPLADGREYFSNVLVTDSGLALPGAVVPQRTTLGELTTMLGPAHRVYELADTSVMTYDVPLGPVLQFYVVGQVLRKVRWVYELG